MTSNIRLWAFLAAIVPLIATAQISTPDSLSIDSLISEATAPDSLLQVSSIFRFFQSDSLPKLTLRADLRSLIRKKFSDNYVPAELDFSINGQEYQEQIKIRLRGKSRRRICTFPPLKLKFSETTLDSLGLDKQFNTLKLVTHCQSGVINEHLILREYLAYRLYNQLTEQSFRVQLVEINYVDTSRKRKSLKRYGFLIENKDELAERLGGEIYEEDGFSRGRLHPQDLNRLAIFQYMIGNTDWQIKHRHNIKVIRTLRDSQFIAVPYDFDYAGLVDAYYAVPNKNYDIKTVRDRVFMGGCRPSHIHDETIAFYRENRKALFEIIRHFDALPRKAKHRLAQYIRSFYDSLDQSKKTMTELNWRCPGQ